MRVTWNIDDVDGIDPVDLLGSFRITDSSDGVIECNCIYIDSIFLALASGLYCVKDQSVFKSEIIDEPGLMEFQTFGAELEIRFDGVVRVKYLEAVSETCSSYQELSNYLKPFGGVGLFKELNSVINKLSYIK